MQGKTVYIENKTGDARVADTVFRDLAKWKKYVLVTDKSKADLVFVLTMSTHEAIYTNGTRVSNSIGPNMTAIISIRIFLNARRKYKTYQHLRRRRIPLIVTHLLA
jgi:fructose-specific component phosphotransferase system IIB-like protein